MTAASLCSPASYAAVVLGGSAGSLEPLMLILRQLPVGFPAPALVVVRSPESLPSVLAGALAAHGRLRVRDAEDKDALAAGTVLLAPPGYHLLVERAGTVALSVAPPERFARPSIDVTFSSAAEALGGRLVAALLARRLTSLVYTPVRQEAP